MLNAGIDRVTALTLTPIDEVMEEINELQRDNNILPRLNQPIANFTPHEPFVSTVDEEGDLQQTLVSQATVRGADDILIAVPEEEEEEAIPSE